MKTVRRGLAAAFFLALAAAIAGPALSQPVTFRLGYGGAAEEPMWLIVAKADLARNYGKAYTLDATRFTSSDKRAQAFEAGAIDLSAGSANGVIFAAAEGITAKFIASISRESSRGFSTSYYVKESSPIRSVADLKGRTVGINGFSTSGHLWLKAALDKHGLADTDVRITPGPVLGDAGIARSRTHRHRAISAALRCAAGKADEGAQDLRCQIRRAVRGRAHCPGR